MKKRIISILALLIVSLLAFSTAYAIPNEDNEASSSLDIAPEIVEEPITEEAQSQDVKGDIFVKSADFDKKTSKVEIVIANKALKDYYVEYKVEFENADVSINYPVAEGVMQKVAIPMDETFSAQIKAGGEIKITADVVLFKGTSVPVINVFGNYAEATNDINMLELIEDNMGTDFEYYNVLETKQTSKVDAIINFLKQTGFSITNWQSLLMILISCLLFYLAICKKFEPLLLLPIAFGMLLTNLMGAEVFHEELFKDGHVHWNLFNASNAITPGLIDYLYLGVKLGIYPCLIFIGVGAMTDFGPLIANPKSLLLGAAAQVGIFATFIGARYLGFTGAEAASIGIIGGADGPTAIFVTSKLAPHLLGPIAVAAYSYMALVPVIQPPIMKALTTKKERQIEMKALRQVSQTEKIIFPIVVTIFVALLVPSAAPLVGCLMLGNLLKESNVCERLSKTVQNELMNIVTIFLGVSVGATATASTFLTFETIKIIVMGVVAFGVATACGVLLAKFMNLFLKNKINPLIGSAGVSAVPMAARVSQKVGQDENPSNFLLMHAMGPNVAGVIGSAIAAGALIAMIG